MARRVAPSIGDCGRPALAYTLDRIAGATKTGSHGETARTRCHCRRRASPEGGWRRALAAAGGQFAVTLVCQEPHPPYQRPPLSKGVLLGTATLEDCLIWPAGDSAWKDVDLRLGVSATAIDREAKTVLPR